MATQFTPKEISFDTLYRQIQDEDKKFSIPGFQRKYKWDHHSDKGCGPFVDDIFNLMNHNEPHFFNSLIYIQDKDEEFQIIDGQQRITSFILLNAAMSTLFSSYDFEITADTLKTVKEKEKYQKKFTPVSIKDIYVNSGKLGYESKTKKTVTELLSDSFVYTKKSEDFNKITSFLFNNYFQDQGLNLEVCNYFKEYTDCKDQGEAIRNFTSSLTNYSTTSQKQRCLIIQEVISFIVARDISLTDLEKRSEYIKLIKQGILLIKDKKSKFITEKVTDQDDIKYITNIFEEITQFYKVIDLEKNGNDIKPIPAKIHKYFDNYYFFLKQIKSQYNDFVSDIYSSKEKWLSHEKEFKKQKNRLPSLFKQQFSKCLKKCKFIEIIITNVDSKSKALDAALSAFASINSKGQSLSSWEVIYSKIFSKLEKSTAEYFSNVFESFANDTSIAKLSRGRFLTKKLTDDEILKFLFALKFKKYQNFTLVARYDKYIEKNSKLSDKKDGCKIFCNDLLEFMRDIQALDNGQMKDSNNIWNYSSALNSSGMHSRDNKTLIPIIIHISKLGNTTSDAKKEIFSCLHWNLLRYFIMNGSKSYVPIFEKLLHIEKKDEMMSMIKEEFRVNTTALQTKFYDLHFDFYNTKSILKDILLLNESKARKGKLSNAIEYNLLQPKYTIEHILPQSYERATKLSKEHFGRLKNALSNLTLLTNSDNSGASDKNFSGKIYYFLVGSLQINEKLVKEIKKNYNNSKSKQEQIASFKNIPDGKGKYNLEIKNNKEDIITDNFDKYFIEKNWLFGDIDKDYEEIIKPSKYLKDKIELLFDYEKFKSYHDFIDLDPQFLNHRKPLWDVETEIEEFDYKTVE